MLIWPVHVINGVCTKRKGEMSPVCYLLDCSVLFVSFSSLINNITLLCKYLDTK